MQYIFKEEALGNYEHDREIEEKSTEKQFLRHFQIHHCIKNETAIWSHLLKKSLMENFIFLYSAPCSKKLGVGQTVVRESNS